MFPPEVWSQYETALNCGQKTTNRNEGYHSAMRKLVPLNASFWTVVDLIKDHESKTVLRYEQEHVSPVESSPENGPECIRKKIRSELSLKNVIDARLTYGKA
jgi:hypothetical protein